MNQCSRCLRITLVNCIGLCPACDDRMKDEHPEGCIAVPLSMLAALKVAGFKLEREILNVGEALKEVQNDLREAVERVKVKP